MPNKPWNKQTFLTLTGMLVLLAGLVAFFYVEGLAGRPIYLFAVIAVAVIVVAIAAVYLYLLSKGKIQQTGPDYRTIFFLGFVFFIFGSASNPAFYAIGLVFIIVGLVNRKKWKPQPKWSEMPPAQRNFKIAAIAILFFLVIGGFVMWYLAAQRANKNPDRVYTGQVTNFEECIAAGNPAMESYPRQCRHDDRTFTENIEPLINEDEAVSIDKDNIKDQPAANNKLKAIDCLPEQRNVDACIEIYQPVCGQMQVECIKAPCDPVKETFENSCKACMNSRVLSYTDGECIEDEEVRY